MTAVAVPARDTSPNVAVELLTVGPDLVRQCRSRMHLLSPAEQRRLRRFRQSEDHDAYLVTHLQLRLQLAARLDVRPGPLRFVRDRCPRCGRPGGRPRLDPFPGLEFSVSHARGLVAVAIAEVAVGVDVAGVPPRLMPFLAHALHPVEKATLTDQLVADRPALFTRCWARKEAVLKAAGVGVGHGTAEPLVGCHSRPTPVYGWRLVDLEAPTRYAAAVAVADVGSPRPGSEPR